MIYSRTITIGSDGTARLITKDCLNTALIYNIGSSPVQIGFRSLEGDINNDFTLNAGATLEIKESDTDWDVIGAEVKEINFIKGTSGQQISVIWTEKSKLAYR